MIIVRVELHSAITRKITELARIKIWNDETGNFNRRNYQAVSYRGRCKDALDKEIVMKNCDVKAWPSERFHIWNLVRQVLTNLGYKENQ